jgi:hypothetical protein
MELDARLVVAECGGGGVRRAPPRRRASLTLINVFAGVAALLAAVGLTACFDRAAATMELA